MTPRLTVQFSNNRCPPLHCFVMLSGDNTKVRGLEAVLSYESPIKSITTCGQTLLTLGTTRGELSGGKNNKRARVSTLYC